MLQLSRIILILSQIYGTLRVLKKKERMGDDLQAMIIATAFEEGTKQIQ